MTSAPVSSAPTETPSEKPSLVRGLSLLDSVLLLVSGIIGSSIFLTAKDIAGPLPHPFWFFLVWILGGAISLCACAAFAELGSMFPDSGGQYIYLREAYGDQMRLSANDVVCAHVSEALMNACPAVDRRVLAISVNMRQRCGLDPMLVGNILSALNVDVRRGQTARSIAERIRDDVDHFADGHCDMRINQQFLDSAGRWRGARCVATGFDPVRWNPLITNWSGFGLYRIQFEGTFTSYCTPLMKLPVAGYGALVDGADGRGLLFQMTLPPKDFEAMSRPAIRQELHSFRRVDDDIPRLHREIHD